MRCVNCPRVLRQWCANVMRSKVEPMKEVARMIRQHFDGIVAWTQTHKVRGYTRFTTMRTVLFLVAGKLDFSSFNLDAS
ncbi:transposase [Paraburkholderia sp. 31.1]|uniref:transposase n=1 Tax=Paraburkholderia sp. 31.1 TaxID=2615205 RepID=UPI00397519AE